MVSSVFIFGVLSFALSGPPMTITAPKLSICGTFKVWLKLTVVDFISCFPRTSSITPGPSRGIFWMIRIDLSAMFGSLSLDKHDRKEGK